MPLKSHANIATPFLKHSKSALLQFVQHACRTRTTGMLRQSQTRPTSTMPPSIRSRNPRPEIGCNFFPSPNLVLASRLTAWDPRTPCITKIQIFHLFYCSTWCSQCFFWPLGDEGSLGSATLTTTV